MKNSKPFARPKLSLCPPPAASLNNTTGSAGDESAEVDLFAAGDRATEPGPLSLCGLRHSPLQVVSLGDFRVLRKLGSGGMGTVYLAYQVTRQRHVALKVLSADLAAKPSSIQRFRREAETTAYLDHPGIVRCLGIGEHHGFHYFVMEYADGLTAAEVLERRGGPLAVPDALHLILRTAEALRHAHGKGIVHRDVKPANIMITRDRQVKLADLGLAKPLDGEGTLTDSSTGVGTPYYMPLEQFRNARRADPRCDIYALGGVLYQFLTGRLPFHGDNLVDLVEAKRRGRFTPARRLNDAVPIQLDRVLVKMLARDPERRYPDCTEVVRDLAGLNLAAVCLSPNLLEEGSALPGTRRLPREAVEILLVEEDPAGIHLAQQTLQETQIPVNLNIVRDGQEAMAFLRRSGPYTQAPQPDLLLLRLVPGRRDGLDFLIHLKGKGLLRTIPVVVLSTSERIESVLAAYELPVKGCISHPAELDQVVNLMVRPADELGATVAQVA
jgi:serine/threonine protein kinase